MQGVLLRPEIVVEIGDGMQCACSGLTLALGDSDEKLQGSVDSGRSEE